GKTGGGEVYVGGGWQGKDGHIHNASKVVMDRSATVDVSATQNGNGGTAVLWSDDYTSFRGTILARGGAQSGNGGRVETSSHRNLQAFGAVDASARAGHGGEWLLDPTDVTIVGTGSDTGIGSSTTDGTDIFTPTAGGAKILNTSIVNQLNAGTNVTVKTSGTDTSGQSGNIAVNANIIKTTGADATLTLLADNSITTADKTSIGSTTGKLNLNLLAGATTNNAPISLGTFINISLNGGDFYAGAGKSDNHVPLTFKNNGQIQAGNITMDVAGGLSGYAYHVLADNDLTINGPVSGSTGWAVPLTFSAGHLLTLNSPTTINLVANDTSNGGGRVVISGGDGVRLNAGNGNITLQAANAATNNVIVTSANGSVSMAAGGNLSLARATVTSTNGTITLNGSSVGGGTGVLVTNSVLNAAQAVIAGNSKTGKGFSLTNTTLGGGLTDLTNVTLSSAGSGAGVINEIGSGIVNASSLNNMLTKEIENTTSIDMGGMAIFDDSAKVNKGWTEDYTSDAMPDGRWIFNNTMVNAGGDVDVKGVGFTNSTVHITSGNLSIGNSGSVFLNGSDVSASGDVVLSSTNGTVNINKSGSKRASVTSELGNITITAKPGSAGSGYSVSLNGADLKSATGHVDITGINTGKGNSGGVYLANTNISADGNIAIDGSALSGSYSGVFLGNSVNLTASGSDSIINITGHSTGPDNREYGTPDAGVYFSGRDSTISAANINISGYNPNSWNSAGIIIGQTDIPSNVQGASFTFNGNTSLYGDGGRFGIDLGINWANTLVFNNGNVSMTGVQRGPRDLIGSGGISAEAIDVGGILPSITNIKTTNVDNFTVYGITKTDDSRISGIGSAGFNGVTDQVNNIKINFSGQVGHLEIKGEAKAGSGVNTQVFNVSSLNTTSEIAIEGESKSGTGVVLSQGDYSKNKVNIIGKSTSGNAVRLDNNISLTNANISGTSGTGSGVVFAGTKHNLTNAEVTGQTEGTSGSGILISGLDGNNVSMHGTSNGSRGTGINLNGPVLLSGNTQLNGTSQTGTGLRVGQKVNVAKESAVTLTGTSTIGTGVDLSGPLSSDGGVTINGAATSGRGVQVNGNTQLNNATVSGNATEGSGIEVKGNLTNVNTTLEGNATGRGAGVAIGGNITGGSISGESALGSGVLVSGTNTTVDGATISGNTTSGVGVNISGNLTNTNGTTVNGSAADGSGVTLGGNLSGGEVTGTSDTGSGVNITGNNSVANNTTLKGNTSTGTGLSISGNLTSTGSSTVSGNSTGSGSGVGLSGNITGGSVTGSSESGAGVDVTGADSTVDNVVLIGSTGSGSGISVSGGLTSTGGSSINGSADSGAGITVNGTVNQGTLNGTSSSGVGAVFGDGANITHDATVSGNSTNGSGAVIDGNVSNSGNITGTSDNGTGTTVSGNLSGTGDVSGSAQGS
ncbi:hypothetical protein IIF46_004856, partial [Salmonella enterica]|nr:hypothetical protein [Salmonella enterica]